MGHKADGTAPDEISVAGVLPNPQRILRAGDGPIIPTAPWNARLLPCSGTLEEKEGLEDVPYALRALRTAWQHAIAA